jgi:hypothetical protein
MFFQNFFGKMKFGHFWDVSKVAKKCQKIVVLTILIILLRISMTNVKTL